MVIILHTRVAGDRLLETLAVQQHICILGYWFLLKKKKSFISECGSAAAKVLSMFLK